MQDYKQAARDFIENEKQFHLGAIPTEQSNPLTRGLSTKIKRDTAEGVKTILAADKYIPEVSAKCFESDAFKALVKDLRSSSAVEWSRFSALIPEVEDCDE